MSRPAVGIIDYGVGNHASVRRTLLTLGYRCIVSDSVEALDQADLLLLPGVGAFPVAMKALHSEGMVDYLHKKVSQGFPLVGICLGMQILFNSSSENGLTNGLGLIPGEVNSLGKNCWHIGWNTLEVINADPLVGDFNKRPLYFNHSFVVDCAKEFQVGVATFHKTFPVIVRKGKVLGLQCHPEKSQAAGMELLDSVIRGLIHA